MLVFDQLNKSDPHLRVVTWSVLAGVSILLAGLWWVQIVNCRHYSENQKAQSFRTVRIPAIRGKILDRQGLPIAENQPNYTIGLYLDELRDQFKQEWQRSRPMKIVDGQRVPVRLSKSQRLQVEAQVRYRVVSNVVQNLSAALQAPIPLSFEQFMHHYTNQLALPLPLLNPDTTQIARFHELSGGPPGLDFDLQPVRYYPGKTSAAHVLGFLVRDNTSAMDENAFFNYRLRDYRGKLGIEGLYDEELRGRAGVKSVLVNSLGYRQSEQIWTEAEEGRNVVLTLDRTIQQAAEEALARGYAGANTRGAVVVMDPNKGDILALVSSPAYDPSLFVQGVTPDYMHWLNDPKLTPQINRALQQNYRPGSIFKMVTALACLDAGLDPRARIHNPPDPYDPRHGHIYLGRRKIDDTAPPGDYDFRRGFIRSSNTYFITNGMRAGIEEIVKIGQRLHLGERTGLLPGQETAGRLPSPKQIRAGWHPGETANICIGQGQIDVTPLQMAIVTAAIANGGKVLWPRLVARIEPQYPHTEEEVIHLVPRPPRNELGVSPRVLQVIREAMAADVEDKEEGTGRLAAVEGLRVCGKTGTAQVTNPRNEVIGHTLWFTSFAPLEQPRYVVLVMIETESSGSGGLTCAPIAREIYKRLLEQEKAQPATLARMN